jgi:O-antigen/teichoic acid export membrane protein
MRNDAGNAASMAMSYNENLIIGQVLHDESVQADYGAASVITIAAQLLLQSLTLFIYPYFVKHINDKQWIWSRFKKIFLLNAAVMIPVHILLFACSKWIILLISGEKYLDAVPIMNMLLIASLGQTVFRGLAGNILVGIGQENFNLVVNIIFTAIHYFLDLWAIRTYGYRCGNRAHRCIYGFRNRDVP